MIDDFGTGYQSMAQLVRLPFSEIKVDRFFVNTATPSEESRAVIRSTIGLSLRVTAEGGEDAAAMDHPPEAECNLVQNFFIGRPMPAADLNGWVAHLSPLRPRNDLQQAEKKRGRYLVDPALLWLVPETGFELVTFALRMRCSTN